MCEFRKEFSDIPPNVKRVVHEHLELIDLRLKGFLDSYYLTGSISMNAFTPGQSDIDFFAVINREATKDEIISLKEIHASIHTQYSDLVLDGFYVQKAEIESNEDEWNCLRFNDGEFHGEVKYGRHSIDAYQLAEYGVSIKGRNVSELCISVDWDILLARMKNNLNTYWVNWMKRSKTFPSASYFGLFFSVKEVEWGVLGVTRLFYTFKEKDIASKAEAGDYALKSVPKRWHKILHESLRLRKGIKPSYYRSVFQRRTDALEFMEYMIQEINKFTKDR
ncbi:hypothetical protein A8F94_03825 [Bacillus sp. FJAT-27225]|nr:hypothetical protein A8F94_03825 [Bacillus sp. FJAT-27225]